MALTRSLKVYNGSDSLPVTDFTDRTDWTQTELASVANLGEAGAGQWLLRDEGGTLPDFKTPEELADAHNVVIVTVGSNTLFRGRVAASEHFRGRQKAGRAKEITETLEDQNSHLRGIVVHDWVRGAETDAARVQGLVASYLSGSPRVTTNLNGSNLVITGSNAVSLPAKTYSGVSPFDVLQELASTTDKEMFVTVDNELAYFGHDYTGYASLLRISDDLADANSTTYAPWDPRGTQYGRGKLSALRSYFGNDVTQSTVRVTNSLAPRYDYWEEILWDSESVNASEAATRAQKELDYRSSDDFSYTCTIGPMSGDEMWKIKAGQSIQFKARAARGGRNASGSYTGDTFLTTRVRELHWTTPAEDIYIAHVQLERPKHTNPSNPGNQALATQPEAAPMCAVPDPGGIGAPIGGASLFCPVGDHSDTCGGVSGDHCTNGSLDLGTSYTNVTAGNSYYSECQIGTKYGGGNTLTFKVRINDSTATLPNITLTLDSQVMVECRDGGGFYTLSGNFTIPTGYNRVLFIAQCSGGMLIKEAAHTMNAYTPPASVEDDPFCLPAGPGDSPYFMKTDDPRFVAAESTLEEITATRALAWKIPVRVATTAAGTLASSFEAGDTIDGVVLVFGDRILLKNQAAQDDNGIYTVNTTGAPTRAADFDTDEDPLGAVCFVSEGTANGNKFFVCTTNAPITLETTNLVFAEMGSGGGSVATDTIWDAAGDLAVGTGADTAARLAIGASNTHLVSSGTTALWAPNTDNISKALIDAAGDLIVGLSDNNPGRLAIGASNTHLISDGVTASWVSNTFGAVNALSSKASGTGDVTTTASLADVTGATLSLEAGTYIVVGVFDTLVNNALNDRTFEGHLDVGGSDENDYAQLNAPGLVNVRATLPQTWRVVLTSTTTVKLRTLHSGGSVGDFTVKSTNTTIAAYRAGGNSGVPSGSSFPGSPATNDQFFRTDRGLHYFYNGTRWLTMTLYEHHLGQMTGISATSTEVHTPVWAGLYDQWLEKLVTSMFAASGLSGSAYWTIETYSYDAAVGTLLATTTNQSGTNAVFAFKSTDINALIGTGADSLSVRAVKTSTPGNFTGGAMLTYRLVG